MDLHKYTDQICLIYFFADIFFAQISQNLLHMQIDQYFLSPFSRTTGN